MITVDGSLVNKNVVKCFSELISMPADRDAYAPDKFQAANVPKGK